MTPTSFAAQHGDILMILVAAAYALLVALFFMGIRSVTSQLTEIETAQTAAAEAVRAALAVETEATSHKWEIHEEEHREFRNDLKALEGRLSHLEGEHAQRTACRIRAQDMGHGSD